MTEIKISCKSFENILEKFRRKSFEKNLAVNFSRNFVKNLAVNLSRNVLKNFAVNLLRKTSANASQSANGSPYLTLRVQENRQTEISSFCGIKYLVIE